jgi:hypothetical protein
MRAGAEEEEEDINIVYYNIHIRFLFPVSLLIGRAGVYSFARVLFLHKKSIKHGEKRKGKGKRKERKKGKADYGRAHAFCVVCVRKMEWNEWEGGFCVL